MTTDEVCHGPRYGFALSPCENDPTHTLIVDTSGGWIAKVCDKCLDELESIFRRNAEANLETRQRHAERAGAEGGERRE